jgi:hypothetical protein
VSGWSFRDSGRAHLAAFLAWTGHAPTADRDREPDPERSVRRAGAPLPVRRRGHHRRRGRGAAAVVVLQASPAGSSTTNYNGESFFVRHAYFTGATDPYAQLKRALRTDIDEDAWASLCSTVSRPFPVPETGRIAVKVINHFGDEVLQVYDVGDVPGGGA